jgi:N-acetylneuraminate synthase
MSAVRIGERFVGPGQSTLVVAEIGINHNGNLDLARRLIEAAANAGCDAVKFQKRTVDVVYSAQELARPRESPFGTTNGELKRGLELGREAYEQIDRLCRRLGLMWFASCWDKASVDFMEQFDAPCYKVASPCLTDDDLLAHVRRTGRPVVMSTGMSSVDEIDRAVRLVGKSQLVLLHCTSAYPATVEELNLRVIPWMAERYGVPVGYSGHEVGLYTTLAAVTLGASFIERHFTLDRTMWGTDQVASVEPHGMARLVKDIRAVEVALGDGEKRVYPSELPAREKLRRVGIP